MIAQLAPLELLISNDLCLPSYRDSTHTATVARNLDSNTATMSDTERPEETPVAEHEQEGEAVPNDEVRQAGTRGGILYFRTTGALTHGRH